MNLKFIENKKTVPKDSLYIFKFEILTEPECYPAE